MSYSGLVCGAVVNASRAGKVVLVVRFVETVFADSLVRVRRVDEVPIAHIDADVRDTVAICILKEHQIAGGHLFACYGDAVVELLLGGSRQIDATRAKDIADETGAVESRAGRPAEHIPSAAERTDGVDNGAFLDSVVLEGDPDQALAAELLPVGQALIVARQANLVWGRNASVHGVACLVRKGCQADGSGMGVVACHDHRCARLNVLGLRH